MFVNTLLKGIGGDGWREGRGGRKKKSQGKVMKQAEKDVGEVEHRCIFNDSQHIVPFYGLAQLKSVKFA